MAFFPNGSVPYLQYIRDGISTIVPQLEEYGYTTYGTHPYRAKGWNREFIYDLMGFDYRYFQGSFPFEDKLRNYVSDEADFMTNFQVCQQFCKIGELFSYCERSEQ